MNNKLKLVLIYLLYVWAVPFYILGTLYYVAVEAFKDAHNGSWLD